MAKQKAGLDSSQAVDELMSALDHPFKREIEALRKLICGVSPTIAEGVKWNAPSFRTTEYFATTNLRDKGGVGIILHLGAKVRDLPPGGIRIDDPAKLLKWLGKDRASVTFSGSEDLKAKRSAFAAIVREWITHVREPG